MDADRYARLRILFDEVRELTPGERRAFLERECAGDAEMLCELEELLVHDRPEGREAIDALQEEIAITAEEMGPAPPRTLPERIGRYRIIGILGEGGMGTVYRAEQTEPIRREVALKLMRESVLSDSMRARFETERQTLARMDHPNIAKVFDADFDDDGRPYLGMELIEGLPITEHAKQRGLSVRDRLAMLLDVCRGVGHAHRKGIIHRDLKPSNVLVKDSGDTPVPTLIDFSIAKSLEGTSTDDAHRTRTGQIIGTLNYMSPEQARGEISAVDTRTDVYALGVLAYELLSGHPPHEVSELPLHEAVRQLSDKAATSLRATTGGATGIDRVPVDVATIVEKCLAKDPERRYRNADELADDLERFLESRPIQARPPSTLYQFRMLARRHRVTFAVALLLLGFLVVYGVTVSVQLQAQRVERLRAEASAEEARREARRATRVLGFLQEMLASAAPTGDQDATTVRELLDRTAENIDDELEADPEALADAHHTLGTTYRGLGDYDAGLAHVRRALELHTETGGENSTDAVRDQIAIVSMLHLTGKYDEAGAEGHRILDWLEANLAIDSPPLPESEVVEFQVALANIETDRRQLEEAERLARDALRRIEQLDLPEDSGLLSSARHGLAFVLWSRRGDDQVAEAERLVAQVLADQEARLGLYNPSTLGSLNLRSVIYGAQGRRLEAAAVQREALERRRKVFEPDHPEIAVGAHNLASELLNEGRFAAAEPYQREALDNWRKSLGPDHTYVGIALSNVAFMQHCLGNFEESERLYREAITLADGRPRPGNAIPKRLLAVLTWESGGSLDEAEAIQRDTVDLIEAEAGKESQAWSLAVQELGHTLLLKGLDEEAEQCFRSGSPSGLGGVGLAMALDRRGDRAEAQQALEGVRDELLDGSLVAHYARYILTHAGRLAEEWGDDDLARAVQEEIHRRAELATSDPDLEELLKQASASDSSPDVKHRAQ